MTYGRAFSSIDKTYSRKKGKGIKKGALKPLQAKATIYKKREFKIAPHLKSLAAKEKARLQSQIRA
jgi:hypothetical protein